MHLNGGFTKVVLEGVTGESGITRDIPTQTIPLYLRAIGTRVLLVGHFQIPETDDSAEDVRRAVQHPEVLDAGAAS